ncbi:hypothetical protein, partial [Mycobacterium avium]
LHHSPGRSPEGKSKAEIIRCLKRFLAREIWASCIHCAPLHKPKNQPLDGYRSINALAETVNGLYKTELIKPGKPWRSIKDVELATARRID